MSISNVSQNILAGSCVVDASPNVGLTKSFPEHWGTPPAIQTCDYVALPENFGYGSSTLKYWIEENLRKDGELNNNAAQSFPGHWGTPPAIQTCDYVALPENFGYGSSTLKYWIEENLKKDEENKPKVTLPTTEEILSNLHKPIPKHWGTPPKRPYDEPRCDLCVYGDGWGVGPYYVWAWIESNLRKDQENI